MIRPLRALPAALALAGTVLLGACATSGGEKRSAFFC